MIKDPRSRIANIKHVTTTLVVIGVALRLWAYAANAPLWLDEILLSRNILDLTLRELLTQPLQLDQVSPLGFLLAEKIAVLVFGPNELALRLFPFLCGVGALLLFRRLASRTLDGVAVPIAVGLFAIGVPLIRYSAEVKQYGVDAMIAVVLLLLALDLRERDASMRRLLLAGAAGFIVIWFSQASVIVMAGIGLAVAIEWLVARDRRTLRVLMVTVAMWAIASGVAVIAGFRSMTASTQGFMHQFWGTGFFPLPFRSVADLRWFWDRAIAIFSDPALLRYRWPAVFVFVALIGIRAVWARHRPVAMMIAGPIVVALVAAVAQQYPFRGRLLLFLLPGLLIALAAALEWARQIASKFHPAIGVAVVVTILIAPVIALVEAPPPYDIEHHRAILEHLEHHRQPGDIIYVFPLTRVGVQFYGPRFGLQPGDWITGVCSAEDTRAYIQDLDRFRGARRIWIVASGARPFRPAQTAVRTYLGTIGIRRDALLLPSLNLGPITLELYDLSNPAQLGAANAATFPVAPTPTDPPPACRPWTRSDAPASLR